MPWLSFFDIGHEVLGSEQEETEGKEAFPLSRLAAVDWCDLHLHLSLPMNLVGDGKEALTDYLGN